MEQGGDGGEEEGRSGPEMGGGESVMAAHAESS